MEQAAVEIKRLQGCINDLVSLLAVPAIRSGHESSHIVSTLLDVLLGMLRLDFVYAWLSDGAGALPIELVRLAQRRNTAAQPQQVGRALSPWLAADLSTSPLMVPNPIGEGQVSIAPLRLGLQDEIGMIVAGSQRSDFPTKTELLLLQVAANQAAIGLQEARLLSEQKRAAEEIRFQAGLLDAVDQAVVATDITGVITYWNRFAERLYGWSLPEVIGRNILDITPIQGAPRATAEMESRWQRGVGWTGEYLMQHRRGTTFPVLVTNSPIHNSQGALIGVVQVSIDITERKRAEEELERRVVERTAQLTAVNEELKKEVTERKQAQEALFKAQVELTHVTRVMTLGELTASIAHEVNQPLTAIVTNGNACLRWLGRDVPDLEEAQAAVARMIRDGHRASDVIQRIRALAKHTHPQKTRLGLNEVIHEVLTLADSEVRQHRVVLHTDLSTMLPPVLGDRIQVQQVLLNLIMNGIEAMQEVMDRPREMRIQSRPHEVDSVLVAVQDAGIGLDPQRMAQLFDAFFTTKPTGMGLGLSISRTIIEAHGGWLWVSPNHEYGTTVQFTLPIGSRNV
jgi:PAS domain S-box-containing protein